MTLTDSLAALVLEHDRIGSPLRSRLGPGLPQAKVEGSLQELGLSPPDELLELFAWHEIRDEPGDRSRVEWFWSGAPLRLEEAVRTYRQSMESGGLTRAEFDELVRTHDPRNSFTGFWRVDWFPILYGSPETYAAVCPIAPGRATEAAVWRASWHPDDGFPNRQVAGSVIELVDRVVELFRLGAYVWDTEYQAVEAVEEVFLREGLDYNVRPWR